MNITRLLPAITLPGLLLLAQPAMAQVTNWLAYNDHRQGTTTGPNVSRYDMRGTADRGPLVNQSTGESLPVRLLVSDVGGDGSDDFGACADPDPGTPADLLFANLVDVGGAGGDGIIGLRSSEGNIVTLTFTNLDPSRKYVFLGTSVRGNNYNDRWAIYKLEGADSFIDAHIDASPNNNLLTPGEFPGASVGPGEVALNSGENRAGSIVSWTQINPGADGGFSIRQTQYTGATPFGTASAGPYGYGMNAMVLIEVGPPERVSITTDLPTTVSVTENRPLTLTIGLRGAPPPSVQWYKDGGILPGANARTYSVPRAALSDAGVYHVVAQNSLNSVNSRSCTVTVVADTAPPQIVRALGSARFDEVVVEFDEVLDPLTGGDRLNYAVEGPVGPIGVVTATLTPAGNAVTLSLGSAMIEGEAHKVIVENVADLTLANMVTHAEASFRAWVHNDCGTLFQAYNGLGFPATAGVMAGNAVNILTSHPSYPNQPAESRRLVVNGFDSREAYPDDTHEGYGGRMRGLFIPPVSGAWRLYLRSDDGGELWFNPNGPGANGKTLVAQETGCCAAFMPAGDPRTTVPMNLVGGQAYFIEALWKEGTGGDYCQVAAQLDGGPTAPASLTPIPKEWLGSALIPNLLGNFTINQDPTDVQTVDGVVITFSVGVSTDVPLCYQWTRDGVDIPDAVGPTYSLTALLSDNSALFGVRVSIPGGATLNSSEAQLTVTRDTTPPVVLSAVPAADGLNVLVSFSETVEQITAETAGNYTIDGAAVLSATRSNNTNVMLVATSPLATCVEHQLVVRNVTDGSANPVSPNPTTLRFVTPITLVANSDTHLWKYDYTGTDLGTDWRQPGYVDDAWESGPAPLGNEDDAQLPAGWAKRTTFTAFDPLKNTLYLRSHFNLPTHPSTVTSLVLREVVDDGSVAYINGVRVNLNRMADPYNYGTFAGGSTEPHPLESFNLPLTALREGDNVIAVEVHQSGNASTDIVYGAEMVAFVSRCGVGLTITQVSPTQVRLNWSDPTFSVQSASSLTGPWATQAGVVNGSVLTLAPDNRFFRLIK